MNTTFFHNIFLKILQFTTNEVPDVSKENQYNLKYTANKKNGKLNEKLSIEY